jgi:hypothetical protein
MSTSPAKGAIPLTKILIFTLVFSILSFLGSTVALIVEESDRNFREKTPLSLKYKLIWWASVFGIAFSVGAMN